MEHIYLQENQEDAADLQRAKIDKIFKELMLALRELNNIIGAENWDGELSLDEGYAVTATFKADTDREFTGVTFGFDKKHSKDPDAMIAHANYCLEVGVGIGKELGILSFGSAVKPLKG